MFGHDYNAIFHVCMTVENVFLRKVLHKLFDDDTYYIGRDVCHFQEQDLVGLQRLDQYKKAAYLVKN